MSTLRQLRLHLFHAASAPRTVILRRGPRRLHQLILWLRDQDRFEDGQRIKADVAPDRCALSSDGRHFIAPVLVGGHASRPIRLYTTRSRPPIFTAVSLFLANATRDGRGAFHGAAHCEIHALQPTEDIFADETGLTWVFPTKAGYVLRDHRPFDPTPPVPAADLPDMLAEGGRLFRLAGDTRHLIRDFSNMAFVPVVAPYAAEAGKRSPWQPLDVELPSCP